jgi:hypothetical protein
MTERGHELEISAIRRRLAELSAERDALEAHLKKLLQMAVSAPSDVVPSGITAASPAAEKVALFRTLFGGRTDVFPLRWANAKTDRAGYAPACANEWVTGVCGKPRGPWFCASATRSVR